jgi:hypothetical protein
LTSRYHGALTSHSMSLSNVNASPARLNAKSYGLRIPLKNRLYLLFGCSRQTVACTPMRVLFPKRGSLNCGRNWRSSELCQLGELAISTASSLGVPVVEGGPTYVLFPIRNITEPSGPRRMACGPWSPIPFDV